MTNNYPHPVSQLLALGYPDDIWDDYSALGITTGDVPELIRLLGDRDLRFSPPPEDLPDGEELLEWYAQIHAWRALAQLKAVEAIPAILAIFEQIDVDDDEWLRSEAEDIFALIGPAAVEPLGQYLLDDSNLMYARIAASTCLQRLALEYPETRAACIQYIVSALENYQEQEDALNAFLIGDLVSLKDTEHLDLIENAFKDGCVNEFILDDFEEVQAALGLLEKRAQPRKMAFSSNALPQTDGEQLASAAKHRKNEDKEKKKRKQEKQSRKKNRKKK